jgi:putative PIN family toxin of toxin-antitoxin system
LHTAPLVVVDTMVVVSGIIGSREGASAAVLDAVATGEIHLAISDEQLTELVRVLGYEGIEEQIGKPMRAFEVGLDIGYWGFMYHPRRLDWPSLSDSKDGWIFDLAYTAGVDYIVSYDEGVRDAAAALGFEVLLPEELLERLRQQYER